MFVCNFEAASLKKAIIKRNGRKKENESDAEFWINGHDNKVTKYTAKIVAPNP